MAREHNEGVHSDQSPTVGSVSQLGSVLWISGAESRFSIPAIPGGTRLWVSWSQNSAFQPATPAIESHPRIIPGIAEMAASPRELVLAAWVRIHRHPCDRRFVARGGYGDGRADEAEQSRHQTLIARYIGVTRESTGDDVKPISPVMFQISAHRRDHSREVYEEVVILLFRQMQPAPKVSLTQFNAGTHAYMSGEVAEGTDLGIGLAVF